MYCSFCRADAEEVVSDHDLVYARIDRYSVSRGNLQIIPKRHFADYFEATTEEKLAMLDVILP